jgi:hypothetical protein
MLGGLASDFLSAESFDEQAVKNRMTAEPNKKGMMDFMIGD